MEVHGSGAAMGPKTQADSVGWRDFTNQGTQAMQTAADRTGAAFEETAAKVNKTFESALQSVPGLFGTSQVTADDMRKSQLGLYQPKADEYLRQLSDEVMNGKDWGAGVDIKDAAKHTRALTRTYPTTSFWSLEEEAWNNSSLFAEGKNLDLINTDAVKAAIEQQQKELSGQASLKALFGITDENLQAQSEALGQGLAAVFGGASETDTVKGAGTALFAKTMAGFSDPATAAAGVKGMADSIVTATGTPENQTALYDAGEAGYSTYYHGWNAAASAAPIVPPGGGTGGTGTTTPPGKAVGVGFWQGGWMQVHANETLYAPRKATGAQRPRERAHGGGTTIVNHVTINRKIDEAALLARLAPGRYGGQANGARLEHHGQIRPHSACPRPTVIYSSTCRWSRSRASSTSARVWNSPSTRRAHRRCRRPSRACSAYWTAFAGGSSGALVRWCT